MHDGVEGRAATRVEVAGAVAFHAVRVIDLREFGAQQPTIGAQAAKALREASESLTSADFQSFRVPMTRMSCAQKVRSGRRTSACRDRLPCLGPNCWPLSMALMRSSWSWMSLASVSMARLMVRKLLSSCSRQRRYSASVAATGGQLG